MNCDAQRFDDLCRRGFGRETVDAFGQRYRLRELAERIVIAIDQKNANVGIGETTQLGREVQAGVEVRPVAIEDVASHQDEVRRAFEGQVDDLGERSAGGLAHFVYRRSVVHLQATQRAVEVNVSTMNEAHLPSHVQRRKLLAPLIEPSYTTSAPGCRTIPVSPPT
jgi:hypothetical protein